mmetsp:Transcript_10666/g.17501  ORF Transcript_10666/g.17501 Transcript_10666/m.17501 type:complete len:214 (+) Transcript_10666:659-1300(+)
MLRLLGSCCPGSTSTGKCSETCAKNESASARPGGTSPNLADIPNVPPHTTRRCTSFARRVPASFSDFPVKKSATRFLASTSSSEAPINKPDTNAMYGPSAVSSRPAGIDAGTVVEAGKHISVTWSLPLAVLRPRTPTTNPVDNFAICSCGSSNSIRDTRSSSQRTSLSLQRFSCRSMKSSGMVPHICELWYFSMTLSRLFKSLYRMPTATTSP